MRAKRLGDGVRTCPNCGQLVATRRGSRRMIVHQKPGKEPGAWIQCRPSRAPLWRETDPGHIPAGSRVLILVDIQSKLEAFKQLRSALTDLPPVDGARRVGIVVNRSPRSADWYMLQIVGAPANLQVGFTRAELLYPVPDGVIPFDPARAKERRRRRGAMGVR